LATSDVLAATGEHHGGDAVSGASLAHFSHERSAWNLALAVGFLCGAARPARTRGMLPLVGAFVGVLTALSAVDLVLHRVEGSRLLSHAVHRQVTSGSGADPRPFSMPGRSARSVHSSTS